MNKKKPIYQKNVTILPITLTSKRIYILPTKQGIIFIIVIFVMLLGALNYGNNLGFLFTFLLSGMALTSILHTHGNLSGTRLISMSTKPAFAGEVALFRLILRPGIQGQTDICFQFSGEDEVKASLKGQHDHTVDIPLQTKTRGRYQIHPLLISTTFPFGLFRAWSKLHLETEYLVYPEPVSGPLTTSILTSASDNEGNTEITGIDDFKELRPYQAGDPLRRLSWKTLSKGRGLFTKEFTARSGSSVNLDWNTLSIENSEKKISLLCDMVLAAHKMGLSYGLSLPGKTIAPGKAKDPLHKHQCLLELAIFSTIGI